VGIVGRRLELFEQVARLRRAERAVPGNEDISAVRSALERELGGTVSQRLAARILGVSHTGLQRWIRAGELPVVFTPEGRQEIPVAAVLDLYDAVEDERGRGRSHVLEPSMAEARANAHRLRRDELAPELDAPDGRQRRAELRALAFHRALARRLRRSMVDEALHRIWTWRAEGKIDPHYADEWERLLRGPVADVRAAITADSPAGRDLRQNSPFAGMLSEAERRKVLEETR
jgi:hypothetical protein